MEQTSFELNPVKTPTGRRPKRPRLDNGSTSAENAWLGAGGGESSGNDSDDSDETDRPRKVQAVTRVEAIASDGVIIAEGGVRQPEAVHTRPEVQFVSAGSAESRISRLVARRNGLEVSTSTDADEQILKSDMARCAEEASLQEYERMPVEGFGSSMLRGMGWDGKQDDSKTVRAVEPRPHLLGLGAKVGTPVPSGRRLQSSAAASNTRLVDNSEQDVTTGPHEASLSSHENRARQDDAAEDSPHTSASVHGNRGSPPRRARVKPSKQHYPRERLGDERSDREDAAAGTTGETRSRHSHEQRWETHMDPRSARRTSPRSRSTRGANSQYREHGEHGSESRRYRSRYRDESEPLSAKHTTSRVARIATSRESAAVPRSSSSSRDGAFMRPHEPSQYPTDMEGQRRRTRFDRRRSPRDDFER